MRYPLLIVALFFSTCSRDPGLEPFPGPSNPIHPIHPIEYDGTPCLSQGQDFDLCEAERVLFELTNNFRNTQKKADLSYSHLVAHASRDWSRRQAAGECRFRQAICHDGFAKGRAIEDHFKSQLSSENVAYFSGGTATMSPQKIAEKFHTMWVNSRGHRNNILGTHTGIGVGIYKTSKGIWGTQIFHRGRLE